ncbi:MAG: glycosyltransferase [Acidobacteria bacterium]|nr:glycosyltransferase [Acidobacteriota bacterium]
MSSIPPNRKHVLTVLVEDYFQVGAFEKLIQERNWTNFVPRYESNTLKALDLLDEYDTRATFFVLGWIADQNPALIKTIAERGHEVASRGYYHRSLKNLSPEEFREDLLRTNRAIESATGQKVLGYRAAAKLNFREDAWILDILAAEGMYYDASFMPNRRDPSNRRYAREITTGNGSIREFPYSTLNTGVGLLPISGGNYLRQIPHSFVRHAISNWDKKVEQPFVFYFHVWELDPEQPRISAATYYNRIRHYRKLEKMEWVIRENLKLYSFTSISDVMGLTAGESMAASALPMTAAADTANKAQDAQGTLLTPVSIVMPCYNEEDSLPYLANTLKKVDENLREHGYVPNFIFVDDCSKDRTPELLNELFGEDENFTIISHETNKGVAGAIMTGIEAARTEIVCSMDCDCTYDPLELSNMIPFLERGADMVTASPYHRDGGVRNVPGWRLFLSKGASFLYRRTLKTKLDTYTSCFRVYRRSAIVDLKIRETGFLGVAELLGLLDMRGGRIVEYPAILEVRLFGSSKMKTLKTIGGHLTLLSRLNKLRFFGKQDEIEVSLPEKMAKIPTNK